MNKTATKRIVEAFTNAISANDIAAMALLMSDDHAFIDSRERRVAGRDACVEGWERWFEGNPGYANIVQSIVVRGDEAFVTGIIAGAGDRQSTHALWRVRCGGGKVVEWQIYHTGAGEGAYFAPNGFPSNDDEFPYLDSLRDSSPLTA